MTSHTKQFILARRLRLDGRPANATLAASTSPSSTTRGEPPASASTAVAAADRQRGRPVCGSGRWVAPVPARPHLESDNPRSVDFPIWRSEGTPPARTRGLIGEPPPADGGLLRGFLSARGPRGFHPLGHRLLLFGRHRSALPRRLGVGRGLRDRGGRSRRPPRGGAPSRGLRRSGGHEHLVDVVQRLDFRLQALDLTLAVGDCLCYDTHKLSQELYRPSLEALWAPAERVPMGSDSSPTRVRRPDGAGAVNAAVPDDQMIPASSVGCGGAGRTERASVLRPTSTGGSPCPPPNPSRVGVVPATAASLTSCSYGLTHAGDRPRSRYGSPRPHLVQEGIANVLVRIRSSSLEDSRFGTSVGAEQ